MVSLAPSPQSASFHLNLPQPDSLKASKVEPTLDVAETPVNENSILSCCLQEF